MGMERRQARFIMVLALVSIAFLVVIAEARAAAFVLDERGTPPAADEHCAAAVATGDVAGDGRADIVVGCPGSDAGGINTGSVRVWIAREAGGYNQGTRLSTLSTTPGGGDACGTSVATGDVTGDGRADLVVGCPGAANGAVTKAGAVVVVPATDAGFSAPTVLVNPQPTTDDECGGGSAGQGVHAADVTGDGKADVLFGCQNASAAGDRRGRVEVFASTGAGFARSLVMLAPDPADGARCGSSITSADMDADKRLDVVVGCPGSPAGTIVETGSVLTYLRTADGSFEPGRATRASGAPTQSACGTSVTATGGVVAAGCPGVAGGVGGYFFARLRTTTHSFGPASAVTSQHRTTTDRCGSTVAWGALAGSARIADDILMGCPQADIAARDGGSLLLRTSSKFQRAIPVPGATIGASCGVSLVAGAKLSVVGCSRMTVGSATGAGAAIAVTALSPPSTVSGAVISPRCARARARCEHDAETSFPVAFRTSPQLPAGTRFSYRVEILKRAGWRSRASTQGTIGRRGRASNQLQITRPGRYRVVAVIPATATTSSSENVLGYVQVTD